MMKKGYLRPGTHRSAFDIPQTREVPRPYPHDPLWTDVLVTIHDLFKGPTGDPLLVYAMGWRDALAALCAHYDLPIPEEYR